MDLKEFVSKTKAYYVSCGVYGREKEIEALLLGLLAKENVLFIGPPGVAKSLLVRIFSRIFNFEVFSYQLNKFTEYQELFGGFDLKKFMEGELERKPRIQNAHIIFLDEVFRGSSAIMNALLSIFRERVVFDGYRFYPCKVIFTVATSNFIPERNYENEAFIDRFPIVKVFKPLEAKYFPDILLGIDLDKQPDFSVDFGLLSEYHRLVEDCRSSLVKDSSFISIYSKGIEHFRKYAFYSDRSLIKIPLYISVLSLILDRMDYDYLFYYFIYHFVNYKEPLMFEFLYSDELKEVSQKFKDLGKLILRDKIRAISLVSEIEDKLSKASGELDKLLAQAFLRDLEVYKRDLSL